MNPYDELQAEHGRLLDRREAGKEPDALLAEVRAYIERVKAAAEQVPDPRSRSQLRANLRFWASFVYDRTGVYPDTVMRPAAQPIAPPPAPAGMDVPVSAAPRTVPEAETPASTVPPRLPARPAVRASLLAVLGLLVVVVFVMVFAALAAQTGGSAVPDLTRATATGSPTTSTARPPPVIPTQPESYLLTTVSLLPSEGDCRGHSLAVSVTNEALFAGLNIPPASVRVTRAGSGEVAASGELSFSGRPLSLCLEPSEQGLYLLTVDHPALIFESLVLQFALEEEAGGRQVSYAPLSPNPAALKDELTRAPLQPSGDLSLSWFLITWGPEPFGDRWVAELAVQAQGGDGNYIFFTKEGRLEEPRLFMGGPGCQSSRIEIGVTSSGRSLQRDFLLRPAGCYDKQPVP